MALTAHRDFCFLTFTLKAMQLVSFPSIAVVPYPQSSKPHIYTALSLKWGTLVDYKFSFLFFFSISCSYLSARPVTLQILYTKDKIILINDALLQIKPSSIQSSYNLQLTSYNIKLMLTLAINLPE